jgi:hypothetical protein
VINIENFPKEQLVGCESFYQSLTKNPSNFVSKVLGTYMGLDEAVSKANLEIWEIVSSIASWGIELMSLSNPIF